MLFRSYLVDFQGDLYGQILDVDFVDRVRDVRRFSGVDELKSQLTQDVRHVCSIVG